MLRDYEALLHFREASQIKRWHTKRTLRSQTIAEHTYGVLLVVRAICPEASHDLVDATIVHDLAEIHTGDIPAPVKWNHPSIREAITKVEDVFHTNTHSCFELTPKEAHILKWADMMELVLWCIEEVAMGNRLMAETADAGLTYLSNMGPPTPQAGEIFERANNTLHRLRV